MIPGKLYIYVAVALVVALALGVQQIRLAHSRAQTQEARNALLEYQAAAAKALAERLVANQALEKAQEQKSQEVKHEYEKRLAGVRGRYSAELERLRNNEIAASGSSALPEASSTTSGVDEPTSEGRFVAALQRCEEDRERLVGLQAWVTEVSHE